MTLLGLFFGVIVGLSLGLTGGGGSIFAVPALVYGMQVAPKEAVAISLAAVGCTAIFGFFQRLHSRQVEVSTGIIFAISGMLSLPVGKAIADQLPDQLLMLMFSALMIFMAVRMWRKAAAAAEEAEVSFLKDADEAETTPLGCKRDDEGKLNLTTRCTLILLGLGAVVGILSGMFGVGGGFVIVPALVLFSGMRIHRAVATSMMVIALISAAGLATFIVGGREVDLFLTGLFVSGGLVGLVIGTKICKHLSGPTLQKGFAVAIMILAIFIVTSELIT